MTVPLLANSIGVDHGVNNTITNSSWDQRESPYLRTLGAGTDIGAYEVQATLTASTTNFVEVPGLNNGSVTGSVSGVSGVDTLTLAIDTFLSGIRGTDLTIGGSYVNVTPVPSGLTPVVHVSADGTSAALSFTGTASQPHGAKNSVSNIVMTFTASAFTSGNLPFSGAVNTNCITFYDAALQQSTTNFYENATLNNGAVPTTATIIVTNDTFVSASGSAGDLYAAGYVTMSGFPSWLTPHVTYVNTTNVTLSFTGTASAGHGLASESVSNVVLTFGSSAFTSGSTINVPTNNPTTNCFTFYDTSLTQNSTNFYENTLLLNGTVVTTNTITLANDTFADALQTDLIGNGKATITGGTVPPSLTAMVVVSNSTKANIYFTGIASPHEAAQSVSNLVLTLASTAFTSGTTPFNTPTTNCITFYNSPSSGSLGYGGTNFYETPLANDGSVNTTNTIALAGDTFAGGVVGNDLYSTYVSVSGVPGGLAPHVQVQDTGTAKLYFTGQATSHRASDSVGNVVLSFNNSAAFTSGNLPSNTNATNSITFYDSSLSQSSTNFYETPSANDGSVNTTNTITLAGDTFNNVGSDVYGTAASIVSGTVPAGLTPHVKVQDTGTAKLYFSGQATLHAAAQSVSNLVLSFTNTGAFGSGRLPLSGTNTTNCISFYNSAGLLSLSSTNFFETPLANNGSVNTTNTITLVGDTFTNAVSFDLLTSASLATLTTPPAGLTAHVVVSNSTTANFYFTGQASAHQAANSVSNLVLTLQPAAFAGGLAATNAVTTNNITFYDDALTWSSTNFFSGFPSSPSAILTTNTITLANDTFAFGAGYNLTANGQASITSGTVPDGLTAQVVVSNSTTATFYFTGNATSHNAANSVSNLVMTFSSSAFTSGTQPLNAVRTNCITFYSPTITWSGSFYELMPDNTGAINPLTFVTGTLLGDTFASPGASFTPANLPLGLTMVVTLLNPTTVQITLTGNASSHAAASNISNLGLTFGTGAFTLSTAANVVNYNPANWSVTFYNGAKWYVSQTGSDASPGDGSLAHPYATLTKAITMAANYDFVHVLPGTITENVSLGISVTKPLYIEGEDTVSQHGISIVQPAASLAASVNRVFVISFGCTNADFRNLTIQNGKETSGYSGGGIYDNTYANLLLSNCVITSCQAVSGGGGGLQVYNASGPTINLYVYASTICSNISNVTGGGLSLSGASTAGFIYDSSFFGNSATNTATTSTSGFGAGISLNQVATGLVQNCTIYSNTAYSGSAGTYGGGGVWTYVNSPGYVTIRNSTIVSNAMPNSVMGGGVCYYNDLILQSTIVAGNTSTNSGAPDLKNGGNNGLAVLPLLTESYNLIGNNANSAAVAGSPNANYSYVGTSSAPTNAMLNSLAYNGGATPTMSLQNGSPAIDHGANPANLSYDQRRGGYTRVVNGQADIGAFESGVVGSLTAANTNFYMNLTLLNGSVTTTNAYTLSGDIFSQPVGTDLLSPASVVSLSGTVPPTLTAHLLVTNSSQALFYFTGQASPHQAAASVSNLVLTFASGAFLSGTTATNAVTTNSITFYDAVLSQNSTNFYETTLGANAYNGSVATTNTITLANDTFVLGPNNDLYSTYVSITSGTVPPGLTPHVMVTNNNQTAAFYFTGQASSPSAATSVNNLVLTFQSTAFASGYLPAQGATNTTNSITFYNPVSTLTYSGTNFVETPLANDGSVITTNTVTLTFDTFVPSVGTDLYPASASFISGTVPPNLTPHVKVTGSTTANIYFTGTATSHQSGNSVNNLVLNFGDTTVFTSGILPASGATITNGITFYDSSLTQDSTAFNETPGANNGSVNTTNTITLANDTFAPALVGTDLYSTYVSFTSGTVPAGLTPHVTVASSSTAKLYFSGQATLHAAANSVSGLTLTFSSGSAFASGNLPISGTASINSITFYNSAGRLSQVSTNFFETPILNNGSVNTTNTITLVGDAFTNAVSFDLLTSASLATLTTPPAGLTAHVVVSNSTTANFYFTGTASPHQAANSVSNLVLNFHGAAFAGGLAATNAVTTNCITFYDSALRWSSTNFYESLSNDGSVSTTNSITLANDTFLQAVGSDLATLGYVSSSGMPGGLTLHVVVTNSATNVVVYFSGNAANNHPADSTNVTLTFASGAFTSGNLPVTGALTTNLVTFYDLIGTLNVSGSTNFYENIQYNDGRIATTNTFTLTGDTFTNAVVGNNNVSATYVSATGVPAGLTLQVGIVDASHAQITLTGQASPNNAAASIGNLVIAFSNAVFASGLTATNAVTTNNVTFYDAATDIELHYSGSNFNESAANNGSIVNILAITLTSNLFSGVNNDVFDSSKVQVSNYSPGLTPVVTRVGPTNLTLALTGNATSHNSANNVNNLTVVFLDAAFYNTTAAVVTNYSVSNLQISYRDPVITWSGSFAQLDNTGAIDPARVVTGTLAGDTFNNPASSFTPANVPGGLTMVVTKTSPTLVTVSLTGTATAHARSNSVSNLGLTFSDSAFTASTAAVVTNSSVSNWSVNFFGNKYYVSQTGNDANSGSSASPFATITHAIAVATSFDLIHILPGTITENVAGGILLTKPLYIEGEDTVSQHGISIVQPSASPATSVNRVFNLYNAGCTNANFRNLTIRNGNDAGGVAGGGIYAFAYASLFISNCVITANQATNGNGAGIYLYYSAAPLSLTIYASTISSNVSLMEGGGIYAAGVGVSLYLYDSAIFGNAATSTTSGAGNAGVGGGFALQGALTGLVQNCTICCNTGMSASASIYGGGGIWSYPIGLNGTMTIRNSTIVSNALPNSTFGGGIGYWENLVLQSSIVAGNTAAGGGAPDIKTAAQGSYTANNNLIGNNTGSPATAGLPNANGSYVGTSGSPVNPLLNPLAYNGGPTPTMSLQNGSLAIDHGANPVNLSYDQREVGFSRVINGQADIGAYESGNVGVLTYNGTSFNANSYLNDGSIVTTNTVTMLGDVFTQPAGTDLLASYAGLSGDTVPSGLTPHLVVVDPATARFYFSGLAVSHAPANNVNNLVLTFTNSGAFLTGVMAVNTASTNSITFYNAVGTLSAIGQTNFSETVGLNDGSISTTNTISLIGDQFSGPVGTNLVQNGLVSVSGLPNGLTARVIVTANVTTSQVNYATANVILTGAATAHAAANSTNFTLTFAAGAFASGNQANAAVVTNHIAFYDIIGALNWSGSTNYVESTVLYDGSIVTTNTLTLSGGGAGGNERFSQTAGTDLVLAGLVTPSGVPGGLTAVVSLVDSNTAHIYLTGQATAHQAANSANFTLTFAAGAFWSGNQAVYAVGTNHIAFYNNVGTLSASSTNFFETPVLVDGSVNTTNTITLTGFDTFSQTAGNDLVSLNLATVAGLPTGLAGVVKIVNGSSANVYLTGAAVAHEAANSTNFTLTFIPGAFTSGNLATNSVFTNHIAFYNSVAGNLAVSTTNFLENLSYNDGRITTVRTDTLTNNAFLGSVVGTTLSSAYVSAVGLPAGLSLQVNVTSAHLASVSLTGNATSHAASDSVINGLVISYSNAVFTSAPPTNAVTTNSITFYDPATDIELHYGGSVFNEAAANDGSIANTITITLTSNRFTGVSGDVFDATKVQVSNVPSGLSAKVQRVNSTNVTLSLTGNATSHNSAADVNNLTVAFQDAAFYNTTAAAVTNSTVSNLQISFLDPVIAWSGSFAQLDGTGAVDPATTITGTLAGDTFNSPASSFTPNNVPAGLTMVVTLTSPTTVQVSLTGAATAHASSNSVSNMGLTFSDSAFTASSAAVVTNSSVSNWSLAFHQTWYVSQTGSDSAGLGTLARPFATITHTMTVATNYDTIHILPGVLTEGSIAVSKILSIEGDGPNASTVQAAATYGTALGTVFNVQTNATFRNLTIRYGKTGGITSPNGGVSLIVSNCVVANNTNSSLSGGAIYNALGTLTVYNSTFTNNASAISGGSIFSAGGTKLYMYNSTVAGNACGNVGGGVCFAGATGTIQNCTISGNIAYSGVQAYHGGGGLDLVPTQAFTVQNSTIVNNSIPGGKGGGIHQWGTVILQSTIIAGNTAADTYGPDYYVGNGSVTPTYCLIGNNSNTSFAAGSPNANNSYVGTGDSPINPMLNALADNGGPTPTCALQAGSPAIDTGSNPAGLAYDQRGGSRVVNGQADIGAYEYGANVPPSVNAGAWQVITWPGTATLSGTVTDDGLPSGVTNINWTQLSGPGTVTFGNATLAATTASFSTNGVYVLQLVGSDTALSNSATVEITANQAPIVNAGSAQTIAWSPSAVANLSGTVTDDGLPGGVTNITWSKQSGPGTVTFGNANLAATTASFSTNGVYVLRLVADDAAVSTTSTVTITANRAPTANAGAAQIVTWPGVANLSGTASDDGLPSGVTNVTWSLSSGPDSATVTFGNANALSTTASFSTSGVFVLQLLVSDTLLSTSVTVTITANMAPSVNAGSDQSLTWPADANLSGTATDDGLPSAVLNTTWSKQSGPGTVTFDDASQLSTTAHFSINGLYVLRLVASDGSASSTSTVTIAENGAPTANAGTAQVITWPGVANLTGTASDDGLPSGVTNITWSQQSGPGIVTFGNANLAATTASFSTNGVYVLQLLVSDTVLSTSVTVQITANMAPVANAGPNQNLTWPAVATLAGTAWDDGLPSGVTNVTWSLFSGPGGATATFGDASQLATTATFSTNGTYVLELDVSDSAVTTTSFVTIIDQIPASRGTSIYFW